MDLNKIILIGRLTKDTELKMTQSGINVAKFSLAVNRKYKEQEEVSFFNCVAWGRLGEIIKQYTCKGQQIAISGRLKQDRWERDGKNLSSINIVVEDFQFIGEKQHHESIEEKQQYENIEDIPF